MKKLFLAQAKENKVFPIGAGIWLRNRRASANCFIYAVNLEKRVRSNHPLRADSAGLARGGFAA